jgi:hypothetical protein
MKRTMKNRTMSRAFTIAAVAIAAVFGVSAAQAFTVQDSNGPVGGQGYIDFDKPGAAPDRMAPVNRFGNENGQTTIKQGNGTFQFGAQQSFGQRYNTDNIFNPYTRDGR